MFFRVWIYFNLLRFNLFFSIFEWREPHRSPFHPDGIFLSRKEIEISLSTSPMGSVEASPLYRYMNHFRLSPWIPFFIYSKTPKLCSIFTQKSRKKKSIYILKIYINNFFQISPHVYVPPPVWVGGGAHSCILQDTYTREDVICPRSAHQQTSLLRLSGREDG